MSGDEIAKIFFMFNLQSLFLKQKQKQKNEQINNYVPQHSKFFRDKIVVLNKSCNT